MKFDRDVYFDQVRDEFFGGSMTQEQVDGQNAILSCWEYQLLGTPMDDLRWLAYMLATAYHETAQRMWPIEEYGKGKDHEYGEADPETGQAYYGRGFVQLTWRDNYHRATVALGLVDQRDLEWHAERALDLMIASRVMFRGMAEGWFTGKMLGDYFNEEDDDPVNARQIVNGNDCDELIAGYHDKFMVALVASQETEPDVRPEPLPAIAVGYRIPAGQPYQFYVNDKQVCSGVG